MSKKAQGMSMNVIIIAALALLVLVVLAIIFFGRMSSTTRGVDQCKGTCVATPDDCTALGPYYKQTSDPCYETGKSTFDEANPICCVGV